MFVGMKHIARAALHLRHEKTPSRPISMDQETIEQAEEMKQEIEPITLKC